MDVLKKISVTTFPSPACGRGEIADIKKAGLLSPANLTPLIDHRSAAQRRPACQQAVCHWLLVFLIKAPQRKHNQRYRYDNQADFHE